MKREGSYQPIKILLRLKHFISLRLKYFTLNKLYNCLRLEYGLFSRKNLLKAYPYELIIDPTNKCQLRCPLCFTGMGASGREKGAMKFSLFKEIIDAFSPFAFHVYLHNWGEPLLFGDICAFIKYAHEAKMGVTVSSNFSFLLDEAKIRNIIHSKLDVLIVSLDGASPEVYSKYRVGGDYNQVIDNIKLFVKIKNEMGSKVPVVKLQYLVMKHNAHQVAEAKNLAKKLGADSVVITEAYLPHGQSDKELSAKWLPPQGIAKRSYWPDKSDDLKNGCWWLWRTMVINWDGTVSPCCYVDDHKTDFGRFNKDIMKIWNNEKYLAARSIFRRDKAKKPQETTVCHACNIAKGVAQ